MTELILFLLLGLLFAVVLIVGGISHVLQQRKSEERKQFYQLKHQVDSIQEVLHQIKDIDPLPDLHVALTDHLLTCLTNLRSLGTNIKSVDNEIHKAGKRRELIRKGAIKFPGEPQVTDLRQARKIKRIYKKVAVLLKRAAGQGLLKAERYNQLMAHINWQKLKVEVQCYVTKAKQALASEDATVAKKNLYHARKLLVNNKLNHPGRKTSFVMINEMLSAIKEQESEHVAPQEEDNPSSDHLENMTFLTDANQKKRSF